MLQPPDAMPELPEAELIEPTPPPPPPAPPPPVARPAKAEAPDTFEPASAIWAKDAAPKKRFPVAIAAGIGVVAIVAIGGVMLLKGRGGSPEPPGAAAPPVQPATVAVDSAALRAADSAKAAAAAAAAMGFVRIVGDLPDDAVLWLDTARMSGRLLSVAPGRYNLEVETTEFQPWERSITVRAGDTLRVFVELELLEQDTTSLP